MAERGKGGGWVAGIPLSHREHSNPDVNGATSPREPADWLEFTAHNTWCCPVPSRCCI